MHELKKAENELQQDFERLNLDVER
jgi:hypothetical protein